MFTFVRMGLTGETTMDAISTPPKTVQVLTPASSLLLPRIVGMISTIGCTVCITSIFMLLTAFESLGS